MDLTSIVAAAAETRLEGTVPRLVHLQGIDSLAPWWTPSTSCPPPGDAGGDHLTVSSPKQGLRTRTISPCRPPYAIPATTAKCTDSRGSNSWWMRCCSRRQCEGEGPSSPAEASVRSIRTMFDSPAETFPP